MTFPKLHLAKSWYNNWLPCFRNKSYIVTVGLYQIGMFFFYTFLCQYPARITIISWRIVLVTLGKSFAITLPLSRDNINSELENNFTLENNFLLYKNF